MSQPINSPEDLQRAVDEFNRLSGASDGSPDAKRRSELEGQIKAFYAQGKQDLATGRPRASEATEAKGS